jgi:Tol biopolymer transport system component
VDSDEVEANGESNLAAISADGRFVAFESIATNLVAGDSGGHRDVFVRDRQDGTTEAVSRSTGGDLGDGDSQEASISADGRYVAFDSAATNLVADDTNARDDVFLRDRDAGTTERVSVDSSEGQANDSSSKPSISADGQTIAFVSVATNLVAGDTNGADDIFLRNRAAGTTERVSLDSEGLQANGPSTDGALSPDASRIVFTSLATRLVPADTNDSGYVFVHERAGGTSFTSLCDPYSGGVRGCPRESAGRSSRGCDNSSATGGAVLAASVRHRLLGQPRPADERRGPTLSVVMQGTRWSPAAPRSARACCVSGTIIRRLFSQSAVDGASRCRTSGPAIRRSRALGIEGDKIAPGEPLVPRVLPRSVRAGLCPAG